MTRAILLSAVGAIVSAAVFAGGFLAGRPGLAITESNASAVEQVASGEKLDRKAVEGIIRDYLVANPEVLLDVQQALEAKQKQEQKVAQLGVIKDNKGKIFNSA